MQTQNLIGGQWVSATSGAEFEVTNPATDEVIARVPAGDGEDARAAVSAASSALDDWRSRTGRERSLMLRRLFDLMCERTDDLARLMTTEQGKPLAESRGEIAYGASFIEWAAEEAVRLYGDIVPASHPGKRILVLRQPVGVTACITPWNFPIAMLTRKLGPALAAGCTMVVKPASQTPLSALALGDLILEAGIPAGVVNIVTGNARAIAGELMANQVVRKVSFTGSTEVGKRLVAQSAQNLTRLSLELGGHAPFIVFDDADLDAAVAGALASKYRNMGQTCISSNRFLVQSGIHDQFVDRLVAASEALRIGPGLEEGVEIGPLIDDAAVAKVIEHVEDAVHNGARVVCGGELAAVRPELARRFYRPTVLEGVTSQMRLCHDETFGPVVPVRRFETEDEAIALANDTSYGLASYFYTRDASRLMRVAEALEYGMVGANDGAISTAQAPFGGIKESGYGREGGKYVMDEYTQLKYVSWSIG